MMFSSLDSTYVDYNQTNEDENQYSILDVYPSLEEVQSDTFELEIYKAAISATPICPKCGNIMTTRQMNEESYIVQCENIEKVSFVNLAT
jgi:lysyl-tRNA synthetase class I